MLIKGYKYKKCPTCKSNMGLINDDIHGCDGCKKIIDLNEKKHKEDRSYLRVTVFYKENDCRNRTEELIFCCWTCFFKKIKGYKKRRDIDFINLPYLSWSRDVKNKYRGDFFKCIKGEKK